MDSVLVLKNGAFFRGTMFGHQAGSAGEVVFNTSLTGYQEILTDPSYAGQIVCLTYPHIGNYGVNAEDIESGAAHIAGLIVRDHHPVPSNWRSDKPLDQWLEEIGTSGLCGVDTRSLVLELRDNGAMRGVIRPLDPRNKPLPVAGRVPCPGADERGADPHRPLDGRQRRWRFDELLHVPDIEAMVVQARDVRDMAGQDLASEVSTEQPWQHGDGELHVVAMDFGIKRNIVRQLAAVGCRVTVVPASTAAEAILAMQPDGVLLSNGPGDPEPVTYAVATIRSLLGKVPIFGICLGHQLLAIACGGRTYKLPFGHRGSNHPVRTIGTGRVEITAQNHGFAVDPGSLDGREVVLTHLHLNDDTTAGIAHRRHPAFSVQFHPEASPGPHDSHHLFHQFVDRMQRWRQRQVA